MKEQTNRCDQAAGAEKHKGVIEAELSLDPQANVETGGNTDKTNNEQNEGRYLLLLLIMVVEAHLALR